MRINENVTKPWKSISSCVSLRGQISDMRVVGDTCPHFWGPDGYYKSASSFLGHYLCHAYAISHHHCHTSASISSFPNLIVIIWAPDKVNIWIKSICDVLDGWTFFFFLIIPREHHEAAIKMQRWCDAEKTGSLHQTGHLPQLVHAAEYSLNTSHLLGCCFLKGDKLMKTMMS